MSLHIIMANMNEQLFSSNCAR